MPVTSTSFIRTTIVLLVVGFLAVLAIVASSILLAGRNDRHVDDLIDVLAIRRELFAVIALVQSAESGERGYLLTLDEAYLQPYSESVSRMEAEVKRLRELARSRPEYARRVDDLTAMINTKVEELELTIELVRDGRTDEALEVVRTDASEAVMESIRTSAEDILAATDATIALHTAEVRSGATLLIWFLAGGGLVILGVVGGSGWIAWRYTRSLEMARSEVMALNATLEARVRARTADVARANEEVQRFAYIVSHDLRSPLVNIMGFTSELESNMESARVLLERVPPDEEENQQTQEARQALSADMPEAIEFIRSSTTKMDRLINAILKLSREGQRKLIPEEVRMRDLFEAAKDSVRHQLDETGAELEIQEPIPEIITDRLSVEQIFGNLFDNAVKYLDRHRPGRIVVTGRHTPMGTEFVVADNGRGISRDDHERIFDLFRRAGAQDRPGEGIGLSHVRALVRRLGGVITLESEPGVGTTFTVRLPRILSPGAESDTI
jgi:signal transduction histidine kinase